MNQRQAKFWVWWLLPVLAARALVPVGFMTTVASGNFKLVMCSEVVKVFGQHSTSTGTNNTHDNTASHVGICPFALSAGAALGYVNVSGFVDQSLHDCCNPHYQLQLFTTHPSAVYRVRGPPAFS